MRVLYFHQYFSTPDGAGGIRSYQMARRLIDRGHRVTMVSGQHKGCTTGLEGPFHHGIRRGMVDGIDVIEVDLPYSNSLSLVSRSWTFLRFVLRTIALVFREDYDVLFATTTPLTVGVAGIVGRWLRRKPFVFEVRDLWPELPRAMGIIRNPVLLGALSALEWASYRSATRLIGLSPGIVDGIARRGVPRDRISMVSNGCDLDIFGEGAAPWRPEGAADGDLLAIFPGAHGVANGLDAVLDAAVELKRRGRDDIKLLLIGDGKLKPALRRRAEEQGLTNVLFEEPMVKMRLAGLMAASDIGMQILANVSAFYYGTSPNKFFDYIAAGRPVLCNYPGWVADLIQRNDCGFAVPPENPAGFADALEAAAEDRARLRTMGGNARRLAQEFDRTRLADQWADWVTEGRNLEGQTGR
ncbi:MAG TPA: glycosyltransferase family 4 protein [Allosphingosinicella sp.]|nr:glycosyltransferase family 4 protein [Allosphingosinicella sp.]